MKKRISMLLVVVMIAVLTACSNSTNPDNITADIEQIINSSDELAENDVLVEEEPDTSSLEVTEPPIIEQTPELEATASDEDELSIPTTTAPLPSVEESVQAENTPAPAENVQNESESTKAAEPTVNIPVESEPTSPEPTTSPTPVPSESNIPETEEQNTPTEVVTEPPATEHPAEEKPDVIPTINIQVGSKSFTATLYDNDSARALLASLPLTLDMSELNGNEKYYYLPVRLPTANERVGSIRTGDLMLYGSDCLVLFYEGFETSYSYTRLGYITDVAGLAEALGSGNVEVVFTANN